MASLMASLMVWVVTGESSSGQTEPSRTFSNDDKLVVEPFERRVKEYVKQREQIEQRMPKLSKESKAEEIEAHKKQLQELVRKNRLTAKRGDIFTPDASAWIRAAIKDEYKGKDRIELRKSVFREAENKGVPLRVNYPYPESQEMLEMPPTLLLRLPPLPKQIRYRFVGDNLLLIDRENGLIIDYMRNAVP
jgi:hypothetical protein